MRKELHRHQSALVSATTRCREGVFIVPCRVAVEALAVALHSINGWMDGWLSMDETFVVYD